MAYIIEITSKIISWVLFSRLKAATEKRKQALEDAEKHAGQALKSLKRMYYLIDDPEFTAPATVKTVARRNVKKILDDVDTAKKKFEEEIAASNITERYWKQVQTAREALNDELKILFPNINIHEKKLSINEEAFDLFILHMYNKVAYLQKEVQKLEVSNVLMSLYIVYIFNILHIISYSYNTGLHILSIMIISIFRQ